MISFAIADGYSYTVGVTTQNYGDTIVKGGPTYPRQLCSSQSPSPSGIISATKKGSKYNYYYVFSEKEIKEEKEGTEIRRKESQGTTGKNLKIVTFRNRK